MTTEVHLALAGDLPIVVKVHGAIAVEVRVHVHDEWDFTAFRT